MRNTFRAVLAVLGIVAVSGTARSQAVPVKLAFIDSNAILRDAPGYAEGQKMIESEMAPLRAMVARWTDSLNVMKKTFTDGEASMSPAVRAQKQKELDDRADAYQARSDSLQKSAQQRQHDIMQPIVDMVTHVIADLRNTEGYALVWDLGAGTPGVVAYDKNLDITERVLSLVKKQPAPALPSATTKAGAPPAGPAGIKKPPPPPDR